VSTVTVLELDGLGTCSQSEKLVTQADTHNGLLVSLHKLTKMVDGILAVDWVARTVGDEDTVEVVRNFVDGVVGGEDGYGGTTRNLSGLAGDT